MDYKLTPWEAKGNFDYERIIKDFGISKIDAGLLKRIEAIAAKKGLLVHHMLRRGIFFAHRDLGWLLDEFEKGKEVFLYTGRGPSGRVHLGHLVPLLFTKYLQDLFGAELYLQFTDDEKFLFKRELSLEDVRNYTEENILDIMAVGFDLKRTKVIIDTKHAGLLYPEAIRVAKKITFSTVKASFGFDNGTNIGSIFFTAMQAVPAFLPSVLKKRNVPCLIPHAVDQDPHFRVTRDILPKLGYYKPASIQCMFLPSLLGVESESKMSSSIDNGIYLSDDEKAVRRKINKYAFSGGQATVEEHRKKGGNPDVDIPYLWLTFFEDNDAKLKKIHDDYRSGKLLSGEIKKIIADKLVSILNEIKERKEKLRPKLKEIMGSLDKSF